MSILQFFLHAEHTTQKISLAPYSPLVQIHPMLVHFPIVLLITSLAFEGVFLWKKEEIWGKIAFYFFLIGFLSGAIALLSGLFAHSLIEKSFLLPEEVHEEIHEHENLAYISMGVWLLVGLLFLLIKSRLLYRIGLLLLLGVLFLTYKEGGELVHDHGVGVKKAQEEIYSP